MKQYDYIHYFLMDSFVFNKSIQTLIEENDNKHSHLFVYKTSQQENNFVDETIKDVQSIEKYLKVGKFIVIHGLKYKTWQILKIKDSFASRLIWCVWGSDLYPSPKQESYKPYYKKFKDVLSFISGKLILNHLANRKISKFRAIFYGFPGDKDIITKKFGNSVDTYNVLYPIGIFSDEVLQSLSHKKNILHKKEKLNILIGHSAFPFLKHNKWLTNLNEFNKQIEVFLPLSYGDKTYANDLERKCQTKFKEFCHIVKNLMAPREYVEFLNDIDWAILDFKHQAAFGNIILLFFLKKRVYMPSDSVMFKQFNNMGLKVYDLDNLLIDLSETLVEDINSSYSVELERNYEYANNLIAKNNIIEQWNNAFSNINA